MTFTGQHFWGGADRKPMTYQERDYEVVDYEMTTVEGLGDLRGPVPTSLEPGGYGVCLGAAQTFGCFCAEPYPRLLGEQLGVPMLNLGFPGPGPRFFVKRPEMMARINAARFAVVQVLSGRSIENSYFACPLDRGSVLPRHELGTRPPIDALTAWQFLLREKPIEYVLGLVEESRRNWVDAMLELLQAIRVPKVLFYFSTRMPRYFADPRSILEFMGDFPQFVTDWMVDRLKPEADAYAEAISSIGMPQAMVSRFTGQRIDLTVGYMAPTGYQVYYPSPEMQRLAAAVLLDPVRAVAPTTLP